MEKTKIALIDCGSYDPVRVREALETGLSLLGGPETFFQKDRPVLVKPNLLAKAAPERCVTTHPSVFQGILEILREKGYKDLRYGDSPGNHLSGIEKVAGGSGLKEAADRLGVPLADFSHGVETEWPEGRVCRKFILCKGALEAAEEGGILNLCKMKTHQLERITGAVKNTFGCVQGFNKAAFHAKYPEAGSFARMLADLNLLIRPRLHIMDGIRAMEGNGPQSGTPVSMNLLLLSADPVALDALFCRLIHLPPELVPTNFYGAEAGVGTMDFSRISILTREGEISAEEAVARFGNPDFDVYRGRDQDTQIHVLKPFLGLLRKKPVIRKDLCVSCGICVRSCPVGEKALFFPDKKKKPPEKSGGGAETREDDERRTDGKKKRPAPKYNYRHCIRCYCCQEMCPEKAILVKTPLAARIADRNWKV